MLIQRNIESLFVARLNLLCVCYLSAGLGFQGTGSMGEVIVKRDTGRKCWARLKLENGDQVMISVSHSGVKVFKMKLAGMIPAAILWESRSITKLVKQFFDEREPNQHPLDSMIDKLIDCRSAAEVGTLLASVSPGVV
jgi:hypothetical protein